MSWISDPATGDKRCPHSRNCPQYLVGVPDFKLRTDRSLWDAFWCLRGTSNGYRTEFRNSGQFPESQKNEWKLDRYPKSGTQEFLEWVSWMISWRFLTHKTSFSSIKKIRNTHSIFFVNGVSWMSIVGRVCPRREKYFSLYPGIPESVQYRQSYSCAKWHAKITKITPKPPLC